MTSDINEIQLDFAFGDLDSILEYNPRKIMDETVLGFLNELSRILFKSEEIYNYPDVAAFAFWCRHSSLRQIQSYYESNEFRLGIGTIFHITPSNVPVNFAFSWAFGLLAGNRNIVKLPSKEFRQINLILECIKYLSSRPEFSEIAKSTTFLRYPHDDTLTESIQRVCRGRVIWGSDKTVFELKKIPVPSRFVDVIFPSRTSSSFLSAEQILNITDLELRKLVTLFLKDVMTFDQKGCSSPKQVFWIGDQESAKHAQERFWSAACIQVEEQELFQQSHATDRLTNLCTLAANHSNSLNLETTIFNSLLRFQFLSEMNLDLETVAVLGTFEHGAYSSIKEALMALDRDSQTVTYFGLKAQEILTSIVDLGILGIDRLVPFGQAFDMSNSWDGHDMIRSLSRIIEVKER